MIFGVEILSFNNKDILLRIPYSLDSFAGIAACYKNVFNAFVVAEQDIEAYGAVTGKNCVIFFAA